MLHSPIKLLTSSSDVAAANDDGAYSGDDDDGYDIDDDDDGYDVVDYDDDDDGLDDQVEIS